MDKKLLWQFPWLYRESIIFIIGIVFVGYLLQLQVGDFDFSLLRYPVNAITACVMLVLLLACTPIRNHPIVVWLCSIPLAVTLLGGFVVLGLIMGLTLQSDEITWWDNISLLGFSRMTRSWPFVLIYFLTLIALGLVVIRRIANTRRINFVFFCNHLGLWVLLFAAGLGYADMHRYIMHVPLLQTEWRVYSEDQIALDLPIAIRLNSFAMEVYPPKLAIIDTETGIPQPEKHPDFYQINEGFPEGKLAGWEINVETYIHKAVRSEDTYKVWPAIGSVPAALITVRNPANGETQTGWVSSGNHSQAYSALKLDEKYTLVMAQAEPKRFLSDITVSTEDGQTVQAQLAVNNPLRLGSWMIYQYGYDNNAGELSSYSSMELVYDPWLYLTYLGFGLMALGAVSMIWSGSQRDRSKP